MKLCSQKLKGQCRAHKANISSGQSITVVNCHWRPSNYGPGQARDLLAKQGQPKDSVQFAKQILKSSDKSTGNRSYAETLQVLKPFLEKGDTIVVTGDFNEPSHLDWTSRYAEKGADRWVQNKASTRHGDWFGQNPTIVNKAT